SLLQHPCVTQGRPRLCRLAIEHARLEVAETERVTRRLVEPFVPARRLHFARLHPAVGIDQEPQEHGALLTETDRRRRVRGLLAVPRGIDDRGNAYGLRPRDRDRRRWRWWRYRDRAGWWRWRRWRRSRGFRRQCLGRHARGHRRRRRRFRFH